MNKALLMAAAGVAGMVATSAMAQPAPAPQVPQAQPAAPPPGPGPGPMARGPGFPPGPGPGMFGPGHRRPGPPPSRAASFRIERGDITISVRCAEEEQTRACVDAAIALMDKANTLTAP